MIASRARRTLSALSGLLCVVGVQGAATPSSAELAAWDSERVAAIAADLKTATRDLRNTMRQVPPPTPGQPGNRAQFQFRDELGAIDSAAGRLQRALEDGAGREQTYPTYQRLMLSVRNAAEEARKMELTKPVFDGIAAAGDALRRLRPYYEEEPPEAVGEGVTSGE